MYVGIAHEGMTCSIVCFGQLERHSAAESYLPGWSVLVPTVWDERYVANRYNVSVYPY
jgi:hypothetical protein